MVKNVLKALGEHKCGVMDNKDLRVFPYLCNDFLKISIEKLIIGQKWIRNKWSLQKVNWASWS